MTSTATDRRLGLNSGAAIKVPCQAVASAPITLSGEQTVNGVAVRAIGANGNPDRVLVTGGSTVNPGATSVDNGVWAVSTGSWARDVDFNGAWDVTNGTLVPVLATPVTMYQLVTQNPINIGSTALSFVQSVFTAAQIVTLAQQGATGNPALENAAPLFSAALATVPLGQITKFSVGQYRWDADITPTGPIELVGDGAGAGPGAVLNDHCSQILPNFATGDVLYIGPTLYGSILRDFQINSNLGQRTSGAGIHLDSTGLGSSGANYRIDNVAFNNQAQDILLTVMHLGTISNTYHQSWKGDAVAATGDGVHESGGPFAVQNYFFGDTTSGTAQNSIFQLHNGYFRIQNNLLLGSQIAVRVYCDTFPLGAPEVVGNWLEEHDVSGIYAFQGSLETGTMYAFNWNEFSVASLGAAARPNFQSHITIASGTPAQWITNFQLIGNRMRTCAAAAGAGFITVEGGQYGQVRTNIMEGLTGNTGQGIQVGNSSNVKNLDVLDNVVHGTFGNRYLINNTEVMFRDFSSRLTATELTAIVCRDGSMAWCEDGQAGSNPLQGSGSGCIAIRERNAWKGLRPQTAVNRTGSTNYAVVDTDTTIAFNPGGGPVAVTLPSAANYAGRELVIKVETNIAVNSASANVIPLAGGAAGTGILTNTAGKFAVLKSDGTNWTIIAAN